MFQSHCSNLSINIILTYTVYTPFSLVKTRERVKQVKSSRIMILPPAPPWTQATSLDVWCDCTLQQLLPRSAAGRPRDRGIVLHVNTVYPTEVKIVPSSILLQQSQRWLSQKQYLDMAADVPKQAQEDRPARGTFGIARLQGAGKSWKQCGLWGHLRESISASLYLNSRHSMGGSDLEMTKNMPL